MKLICPICKAEREVPEDFEARPFCSPRCKLVDLGNWLGGVYRVSRPLGPEELEDEDALLS